MALNLSLPFRRPDLTAEASNETLAPGQRIPLIGHLPPQQQLKILGITLALIAAVALALGAWLLRTTNVGAAYVAAAAQMQTLSQRIAKAAQQVLAGAPGSVAELKDSKEEFTKTLSTLKEGGSLRRSSVPASSGPPTLALAKVESEWAPTQRSAEAVLQYQSALATIGESVKVINERNFELLETSEQVVALKLQSGAPSREVSLAGRLVMLTQRMAKNANAMLVADVLDPESSFLLQRDGESFRQTTNALLNGSDSPRVAPTRDAETADRLREIEAGFKAFGEAVTGIITNVPALIGAKQSARSLVGGSAGLLAATAALEAAYDEQLAGNRWFYLALGLLGICAVATVVFVVRAFRADSERRAYESQRLAQAAARQAAEADRQNKQNQEAILRLMNEMTAVADGDLTVKATVTEDITGAIADSVNYTVEELRTLVGRINTASEQVTGASAAARTTSTQLLDSAEAQSRQIQEASSSVLRMARAINDVSASASRSVNVARQSLSAAEEGTAAVHNSISGMNDIRAQIQETSKRIKRLGESSQQIGEIVELISDITERTQVLALNAAIQAASAGEAGRGFTVVAEEVQRLAERSTEATRQIAAIVKTIQTDTLDAVGAMERSTQGVVEGARLSDAAGKALAEIGDVSRRLAGLIEEISVTAQSQAQAAGKVATGMQEILSMNKQASEGTKQTAKSVGELAQVASELRASVANFRI